MSYNKTQYIGPFRIDSKNKKLIEKAAKLERRSVSDFVRLAAIDKATEILAGETKEKKGK